MKNAPSLPWWGWSIAAFVVLNVILSMDVSIFWLLLLGLGLGAMLGTGPGRRTGRAGPTGTVPRGTGSQQPTPQPGPPAGAEGQGATPADSGGQGATPADSSPWHTTGQAPGPSPQQPGTPSMPRIEVPGYPGDGGTAYPSAGPDQTDPVVSLGQLQLSRCSRDLHVAATTGSATEVGRVLTEIDGEAGRLLAQLGGGAGRPGRGHRELVSGLRSLQRDVAAARDEDPPGARVARVVRATGAMGQTGRYE